MAADLAGDTADAGDAALNMALADDLHPYQYLWDGSQPGWGLTHINSQHTGLALQFSVPGGSAQERLSARKTIEEFKPLSIQQVTTRLHGCKLFPLGQFEAKEARRIAAQARQQGLTVLEEPSSTVHFLPTNLLSNRVLLIDDENLAKRVYEAAILHGVPVRHIEA
ncbi:hypothetical protein [Janthinobacterium sp. AD80]|uniref:hypothetical protein n=1 Tax=Janthinobacterium sp. AD80 TaxID=1528773 RepID=UPI0011AFD0B4|nr:hypothetical protein [Janthinobacterium sp. AD80]